MFSTITIRNRRTHPLYHLFTRGATGQDNVLAGERAACSLVKNDVSTKLILLALGRCRHCVWILHLFSFLVYSIIYL